MTTNLIAAISAWRELLGADNVLGEAATQQEYGHDTGGARREIPCSLKVSDPKLLPQIMRIAQQFKAPVYPISTGHNWGYGSALPAEHGCTLIDLSSMNKILHFDSELGVVTLEPGVTQGMLANFLELGGHGFLVPVTGAGPSCSLLANALERGYGITPYTDHFAAVTDLEAVLADGSTYKTAMNELGGPDLARLFKWGIGPYSAGLFTQSGLGIVTRVSILLVRRPACVKACLFSLKSDAYLDEAVLRIRTIMERLQGTVGAVNLMNRHRVLSMSAPYPHDRLNAEGVIPTELLEQLGKQYQIFPWTGFATLYGTQRMVAAAQAEMKSALKDISARLIFLTPSRAKTLNKLARALPGQFGQNLYRMTGTLAQSLQLVNGQPNEAALPLAYWRQRTPLAQGEAPRHPARDGCGLLWYAPLVPMRPKDVRAYANFIHATTAKFRLEPLITFTTLSGKLFDSTVPLIFDRSNTHATELAQQCYEELMMIGQTQGWFPYRVGINTMVKLQTLQTDSSALTHQLRLAIDPHNILAPGRYR